MKLDIRDQNWNYFFCVQGSESELAVNGRPGGPGQQEADRSAGRVGQAVAGPRPLARYPDNSVGRNHFFLSLTIL